MLARSGVCKCDARCVKIVAPERWQQFAANALLMRRAVERVTHHRESECGKMDADLVRAAGVQISFDEREIAKTLAQAPIRAGFAAFTAAAGHARTAVQIARYRQFDNSSSALHPAVEQRDICLLHTAVAKFFDQFQVCGIVARDHNCARSSFVQAMHDPRSQRTADGGEPSVTETIQEGGDQRASVRSCAWMDDHSRGLVHYGDVGVFIKERQRNIFWFDAG